MLVKIEVGDLFRDQFVIWDNSGIEPPSTFIILAVYISITKNAPLEFWIRNNYKLIATPPPVLIFCSAAQGYINNYPQIKFNIKNTQRN